ncbi:MULTISPECIES: flagellar basal-body MS-ring/collar protein FliF [unclassified Modicisalibacter]|uniref:flagellar basal-body MS-ring/collar protein FliF n=1 Tax=unclassified Modicisalibacter TaxID=2679913 RepID=UPI001CCCC215|nr:MULTISPECIES: flagellar basal-body MS-ring/collar protein FliF [unclassified Modicisalibacter]MBZ9556976.1 flagellar M-ring protein FliF [Modicisalibacter sp. R2A 31.J]MBZ9574310.1 flagellar M-ring protein FliF [Modicisalibacter sp. MOD 31.J]
MSDAASSQPNANRAATGNTTGMSAQGLLAQLRGNPRIPLIIAAAAAIAIIAALLLWARSPEYRVLYSNLTNADGGRIISELDKRGIPYQFSEGGGALLVPADQVHPLRLQLAEQGLPKGGDVGFELMDNQAFGISQFAEHVNYQRSLEGELSQSIKALGPVAAARVHLSLAKPSVFVRESQPAKASVILTLEPGRALGDGQVNAIVHMVSSSVSDLAPDNVTVVDQNGRLLSRSDGGTTGLDGTQLDYIQEVENTYQQRIERILAPILGANNVRAQVAAQIDFSKREQTAERYQPNQPPNQAAVRSRQLNQTYTGGDELANGVPGALSNTPPGAAASPIDNGQANDAQGDGNNAQDQANAANGQNGANTQAGNDTPPSRLQSNDTINYEVDRQVEHVQFERGDVQRLSVAVVVDYRDGVNDAGEPVKKPLSDEEMASIKRLVRQAMGFSENRGDAVEVVNSPFAERDDSVPEVPWWKSPEVIQLALTLGRYLLVALAALFLWFMVLRPLIKRNSLPSAAEPALRGPTAGQAGVAAIEGDGEESAEDTPEAPPQRRRRRSTAYEQNLKDAREMAQEDPRLVAMIVRSWMSEQ